MESVRYRNERAVPEGLGIRIGVSACLLGRQVRYDGGHKRDSFLVDVLGPQVEWVPVCPEVELGMGTPRPAVRLEDRGAAVALVEPVSGDDHTGPMLRLARQRVRGLRDTRLCGFVLKRGSPSCGGFITTPSPIRRPGCAI